MQESARRQQRATRLRGGATGPNGRMCDEHGEGTVLFVGDPVQDRPEDFAESVTEFGIAPEPVSD